MRLAEVISGIRSRLGGEKHQNFVAYRKIRKHPDFPFSKEPLKKLIVDYMELEHNAFFHLNYNKGGRVNKQKIDIVDNIYKHLCDIYTANHDSSLFNFNGALLAKPVREADRELLVMELMEFLIYYFCEDIFFCDLVSKCRGGPYEYGHTQINSGDVVFDCGANMGAFSALASRKCGENGGRVYAFEPYRFLIDNYLQKVVTENPNITICEYAITSENGQIGFSLANNETEGRISTLDWGDCYRTQSEFTVQSITLDTFVERNKIRNVDFIKADIEGAERYLLMGAKQVLRQFAPKLVICTYHLPDDPKVLRELILEANPKYIVEQQLMKIYAYVP